MSKEYRVSSKGRTKKKTVKGCVESDTQRKRNRGPLQKSKELIYLTYLTETERPSFCPQDSSTCTPSSPVKILRELTVPVHPFDTLVNILEGKTK